MRAAGRRLLRAVAASSPVREGVRRLSMAGLVPRPLWKRLPVDREFVVALPGHVRFRYRSVDGDAIGRALFWTGLRGWERHTLLPFMALARGVERFLDIGANTGAYTLVACAVNPRLSAVAYEPVPRIHARLAENLALNELAGRAEARNVAVGPARGRVPIHVPSHAIPTSASLLEGGYVRGPAEVVTVDVVEVDGERDGGPPVGLIKLDVEGFEDRVLAGMTRTLVEDRPLIVCECNPDGPYAEVERLVAARGYAFFHLGDPVPVRMPHIVPDPTRACANYLLVPSERMDAAAHAIGAPV